MFHREVPRETSLRYACRMPDAQTELRELLESAAPVALSAIEADQLVRFVLLLAGAPLNVTATRGAAALLERHVIDALRGLGPVDAAPDGPLIDVGSGGGSPGIVLGIVRPQRELHLVESVGRKAAFLRTLADELGVAARVHPERSELLAAGPLRDSAACVTARALAPPPVAIELCAPLVRPGGRLVLWSRAPTDAPILAAAQALACSRLEAGGDHLVFEKQGPTPAAFPRRPGMAAKRPLARG